MNKKLWLIILVGHLMNAQQVSITRIDPKSVACAREVVRASIERRNNKRILVTCLIGAAAAAGGYGLWKVFKSLPACACKGGNYDEVVVESVGMFRGAGRALKGFGASVIYQAPTALFFWGLSAVTGTVLTKGVGAGERFYRSLNWSWFAKTHVKLPYLFTRLKYSAARLDSQSTLFDQLKDVKINWDSCLSVRCKNGQIPVSSFDELVQLKALSKTTSDANISKDEVARTWNEIVRALIFCLGFIEYQLEVCESDNSFDKNQIIMFKRDVIQRTNEVAENLVKILKEDYPSGLLTTLYEYCSYMHHLSATLEINDIVEG